MSKHIVSGAIALLMVFVPVSASALTPIYIPQVPQNPTVEQLQQLIVQLTTLLQRLILNRTSPQPTLPISCPFYNAPLCAPGSHLEGGGMLPNGCNAALRCVADNVPAGGTSITVTSAVGPLDSDQHYVVNATFTNIPPSTVDLVKNDGLGTDVQTFMPITSSRGWDAFFIRPGIPAGSYFLRVHESATGRVVAESAPFYISDSPNIAGALTVSTDPSSPALTLVAGGTTGVTLAAYKFRATGEAIQLDRIGVRSDAILTGDLSRISAYTSNGQLLGTGVFLGTNKNASIDLTSLVTVLRDTDTTIIIKGDIAPIGTGQPGRAGDVIKVEADTSVVQTRGTGVSSGMTILATGGTSVAGVLIQKSYPTVASISLPSSSGLEDGKLMRFSVTANTNGAIGLGQMTFRIETSNATVGTVTLYAYTDSGFSIPVSGLINNVYGSGQLSGGVIRMGGQAMQVPAGQTRYFELRGAVAVSSSNAAVVTTLVGDGNYSGLLPFDSYIGKDAQFIWSPNSYTTSVFATSDWTTSFTVPGLPVYGISQTRTSGGTIPTSSPRITYSGVSSDTISATYNDMPANSQVVIINQTSGARLDSVSTYIQNAGSGSISIPFPPGTPAGTYYLKAMNYSTQAYIAQTVSFTYSGATTCVPPSITMPPVGYSLIISQPGQGQTITATGGAAISMYTTYPWATFSGSTLTFTSIPVAGTYPVAFTATNTCGSISQQFNVIVEAKAPALPTADIKANVSDGPITIAYGATATISWSSSNVSACGIVPSTQAYWVGNYGTSGSKDSGSLTQSNTYTLQCNGNNGQIISDTVTVNVTPQLITVPVPVPTPAATCTYTPGSSKYGDKYAPPGLVSSPVTINIEGGQAACSAWCSSKAAEANVYYTCAYNGATISISNSNVSHVAFEASGEGTVAGASVSYDDALSTINDVLQAVEKLLHGLGAQLNT